MGVKIPWQEYLAPQPVLCAWNLKKSNDDTVSSPPSYILDRPFDLLLRIIKWNSYVNIKLLHSKIFELFWNTEFDFLRFHTHKTGWGARYSCQGRIQIQLKTNSITLPRILPTQLTFNSSIMTNDNTSNKIGYRQGSFTIMQCDTIRLRKCYINEEAQEVSLIKNAPGSFTIIMGPQEVSRS